MNIFYTEDCPIECSLHHCDIHVNKMIIEYSQLLSTAHHVLDDLGRDDIMKKTHENHPCAIWVRESHQHYDYVYRLLFNLHNLYSMSHELKAHASSRFLSALEKSPNNIPAGCFVEPPQCMPEKFQQNDTKQAYMDYLNYKFKEWLVPTNKARPATWYLGQPDWVEI